MAVSLVVAGEVTMGRIIHECLLDQGFQLSCLETNKSFTDVFWDEVRADLSGPNPSLSRVMSVMREIQTAIGLVGAGEKEASDIGEMVDLFAEGVVDFHECTLVVERIVVVVKCIYSRIACLPEFVVRKTQCGKNTAPNRSLTQLQARKRVEETKETWNIIQTGMSVATTRDAQALSICTALQFILTQLHFMRVDQSNDKIRLILPFVRENGVSWLQMNFQEKLDKSVSLLLI
jgi:hypothetical protein